MAEGFRDFKVKGRRFGFAHVSPLTLSGFTDASPEVPVEVLVTFNSHCWSEEYRQGDHTPDLLFKDERGRKRAFSEERYEASRLLPAIMQAAWNRSLVRTDRMNFALTRHDLGRPFTLFLGIMPSRNGRFDVHCHVLSAYRPTNLPRENGRRRTFCEAVDSVVASRLDWRHQARRSRVGADDLYASMG